MTLLDSLKEEKHDEKEVKGGATTLNEVHFFKTIGNFRDVAANYNTDSGERKFKEGIFFRSATLDAACNEELEMLKVSYNIVSIIDLRSQNEMKGGNDLINTFPTAVLNKGMAIVAIDSMLGRQSEVKTRTGKRRIRTKKRIRSLRKQVDKAKDQVQSTYYINFACNNYRKHVVWEPLSFKMKCEVVGLVATKRKPEAIKLIGSTILQPRGLEGLYQGFVDYCGEEIVAALKIMASSDSYPVLVHCTQGKDRTGLVCAMALAICGAKEEYIIKDYERSQKGLDPIRKEMIAAMEEDGLTPEFSDAPGEVMRNTLRHIEKKYGNVEDYLKLNGLEDSHKESLIRCLVYSEKEELNEEFGKMKIREGQMNEINSK